MTLKMSTIAVPENAPSMQLAHERDVYIRYIETLCELYPSSGFYLRKLAEYLRTPSDWNRGMPGAICVEVDPLARHQPQLSQFSARPSNPRFVIVEGFPAPETIAKVGSRYSVRPELFLGHLEIERTQHSERTSFELPTLPSLRGDIVHVRLIRLARSSRNRSDKWDSGAARINANRLCHNFEEKLFRESRFGTTRVRKINAHGEKYFSVEQMVSFSVAQTSNEPWTGGTELGREWRLWLTEGQGSSFLTAVMIWFLIISYRGRTIRQIVTIHLCFYRLLPTTPEPSTSIFQPY